MFSHDLKLLTTDYKKGHKTLTSLVKQIQSCDNFIFSVTFIIDSGVASIIDELEKFKLSNK
jgi:HKD family nuclease